MKFALIADDLTGRNDCALQWHRRGIDVCLPELAALDESLAANVDGGDGKTQLIALNAESRHLSSPEARKRVVGLIDRLQATDIALWYKKIDSTLRGNLESELDAFLDRLSFEWVVIHPGYPAGGRTVVDGFLHVDGRRWPVEGRGFVSIASLFALERRRKIGLLRKSHYADENRFRRQLDRWKKEKTGMIVIDAETEEELGLCVRRLRAVSNRILWVGSLGLASALAGTLPGRADRAETMRPLPRSGKPLLFVAGSYNGKTRGQIRDFVRRRPCAVVEVDPAGNETEPIVRQAAAALNKGLPVIVCVSRTPQEARSPGFDRAAQLRLANRLGEVAAALVRTGATDRIVATGGDTAKAVTDKLGVSSCGIVGEIESGVPVLKARPYRNLYMVTKAGGFGTPQVFTRIMDMINRWEG